MKGKPLLRQDIRKAPQAGVIHAVHVNVPVDRLTFQGLPHQQLLVALPCGRANEPADKQPPRAADHVPHGQDLQQPQTDEHEAEARTGS